jgi:hypothetical protein
MQSHTLEGSVPPQNIFISLPAFATLLLSPLSRPQLAIHSPQHTCALVFYPHSALSQMSMKGPPVAATWFSW